MKVNCNPNFLITNIFKISYFVFHRRNMQMQIQNNTLKNKGA